MSEESPAPPAWTSLDAFLAEDPRRTTAEPISYGHVCSQEAGSFSILEEWELLWFPATGELIEHRSEADPGVRLVGNARHHDYIDTAIAESDSHDRDVEVHRRRWEVTHPAEPAGRPRSGWRVRSGSAGLRDVLSWWEDLMHGRNLHEIDEAALINWGHTVDHVTGRLPYRQDEWDELGANASDAVSVALLLEQELRGRFNLARVTRLADELYQCAIALHETLLEAYGAAHRDHPGRQTAP